MRARIAASSAATRAARRRARLSSWALDADYPGRRRRLARELAHEGGLGLAERLGTEAEVFPGAHGGFESHAPEFAVSLMDVLQP